jgi:hypothetical protein
MIELNLGPGELEKLYDELDEEIQWVDETNSEYQERLAHHQRLYLGKPKQKVKNFPWPRASNVVVPIVGTFVDAVFARHMNSLFGTPTFWMTKALSKAWVPAAPLWRDFLEYESYYTFGLWNFSCNFLMTAVKHGLAIAKVAWERTPGKYWVENPQSKGLQEVPYLKKDGPMLISLPLEQCIWADGSVDVASARWVGWKYFIHERTLDFGARRGFYSNVDKAKGGIEERQLSPEQQEKEDAAGRSAARRPRGVWLHEVSWSLDLDGDGIEEEVVLWLERRTRTIVRATWHPYWHQRRYFVGMNYWPVEGQVEGLGMCGMLEQLAEAISTVHNQATDNATAANTRIWGAKPGNPQIRQGMQLYPGKVVFLDDPEKDLVGKQLGEVYPSIIEREAILRDYSERRVGVTDYSLGRESPVVGWRATATSTLSLLQEAARRFDLTLRSIREGYREVGLQVTELYQQYKPMERLANFFEERLPEVLYFMQHPPSRVRDGLDVMVAASSASQNREQEKESFLQLFQILQTYYSSVFNAAAAIENPQIGPLAKGSLIASLERGGELMKRLLEAWPLPDPKTFVVDQGAIMEVLNGLRGQNPGGVPGTGGPAMAGRPTNAGVLPPPGGGPGAGVGGMGEGENI